MGRNASSHSDTKAECTANVQKLTIINCGARLHQTMTRIGNGEIAGCQVGLQPFSSRIRQPVLILFA